jgi:tRNA pseudouridine55 synthase
MIHALDKSYRTLVRLGAQSDTDDALGSIRATLEPRVPPLPEISDALGSLRGRIMQQPPEHSALKVKGERAYDLARAGRSVTLAARMVEIGRIEVIRYSWPDLELEIDCSKGTYIRSIARDLGDALGCGGYVQQLERTRIGPFTLQESVSAEELSKDKIDRFLRPPLEAVAHLQRVVIAHDAIEAVLQGRPIVISGALSLDEPPGLVALVARRRWRPTHRTCRARHHRKSSSATEGFRFLTCRAFERFATDPAGGCEPRNTASCLRSKSWGNAFNANRAGRARVVDAIRWVA